jgi:putative hemolysin
MNTQSSLKTLLGFTLFLLTLSACTSPPSSRMAPTQTGVAPVSTSTSQANMPNPASVYCAGQGFKSEIRTDADGSQSGVCIFPDGSECDEWAYFRKECGPVLQSGTTSSPTEIPTAMPIDPADYQPGWWTYIHPVYLFSIMLPQDWVLEEITTFDPEMNGHTINIHSSDNVYRQTVRMTFTHVGEDVPLWPTGVGQGEFIQQGTLDIAGKPARRMLLVCPTGEVTSIWYHDVKEDRMNITRGNMEFGFIFSAGSHCEPGLSLGDKVQRLGEMIIASLKVP